MRLMAVALMAGSIASAAEVSTTARTVGYHDTDIISVFTQIGYSTLVQLPKSEEIVGLYVGDKEFFPINWQGNFVYIKSAGPGKHTNMNVQTTSGRVYSFLLNDVTPQSGVKSDLKVYVNALDNEEQNQNSGPKFVRAEAYNKAQEQVQQLSEKVNALAATKDAEVDKTRQTAILSEVKSIKHEYTWDHGSKAAREFGLKGIWHDATHTYVEVDTQTAPALYEISGDGKDSIVQYTLHGGVFEVPKVMEAGYLRHGKSRIDFKREKEL